MTSIRNILCATVFGAATLAASSASATAIYLNNVEFLNPVAGTVTGPGGFSVTEYFGVFKLTANTGIGPSLPTYTLWGFCVDLFREVRSGPYQYHTDVLVDDARIPVPVALSSMQIQKIYGLASLGAQFIANGESDLLNKLSGIQGAIWVIEYPDLTFSTTNVTVQNYINAYVTLAPGLTGEGYTLYADDFRTQGFVIGTVPEPGTWMMMIMGFGLIGLTLRNARRRTVAA